MLEFRQMTAADIPDALTLCRFAGWNQVEHDWQLFLRENAEGCFVAISQNRVAGTVTTIKFSNRFSWIGMVLVHPDSRRQGLGTALLHKAMEVLGDMPCMKLDATPAGREVYLKLNFTDEYMLGRMKADKLQLTHIGGNTWNTEQRDWNRIIKDDRVVFGADRSSLLNRLRTSVHGFSCASEQGYCFGRRGYHYDQVGPIVASSVSGAKDLLMAALAHCGDRPVIMDVPQQHTEWMEWLVAAGFREERPFTRMFRGQNAHPGLPGRQYAILGPEFG